ncbi:MAG: hypothetical protein J0L92_29050 [Deltaproteobacteria bacterium]|nr:hypothetical protein [Deltaproteobacteria bacterium]
MTQPIYPILHHPSWAAWDGAACRRADGGALSESDPLFGITTAAGDRPLRAEEILALGDPAAVERQAIANLEAIPYELEDAEMTKGFLGLGKKPLTVRVRGRLAPERVLSPAFLAAARARVGNPRRLSVAIPDRETIYVRSHDEPHFGTAFEFSTGVLKESAASGRVPLCNGLLLVGERLERSRYVRPPGAWASLPFATRALAVPKRSADGTLRASSEAELDTTVLPPVPVGLPLRLRGWHRAQHHIEVEIHAANSAALGDAARAYLKSLVDLFPGSVVRPMTGVFVVAGPDVDEADLEWGLRHELLALHVADPKSGTWRPVRGPSIRSDESHLGRPLAELRR